MKKPLFIKIIFLILLVYLLIIYLWYLYPSGFFCMEYKNVGKIKLKDLNNGPYLFVVDHEEHPLMSSMIISQELHNHSDKNQKYNVVTKDCNEKFTKLPYFTKYNIIKVKGKTVGKCIEKIKNKENVVIFLRKEKSKNTGIYYILKETKIPIVLIKKKIIKQPDDNSGAILLKYRKAYTELNYNLYDNYEIEKKEPGEFLKWLQNELFN